MDLIYYRGLNCHLACIINIANVLGVNYLDAFADLWSETDFADEIKYNIYVSKRVFVNLEAMGVMTEMLDCDKIETEAGLSRIPDGAMFVVGMDTFFIPWHPVFRHFHDSHYFVAQKEAAHSFLCFDPVYQEKNKTMKSSDILSASFELGHVYKMDVSPTKNEVAQEAGVVLRGHPGTREKLLGQIRKCEGRGRKNIGLLIKQINAMLNNRYLFQRFLHGSAYLSGHYEPYFNKSFFSKWEAVKNGLYKASIMKENRTVIDEVYGLFADLMGEEVTMAKEIIAIGLSTQAQST